MVSSSKYGLWTVFAQVGSSSPRWESSFAQARVQSPRRESPWSKCSLECFCLGEKSFAQARVFSLRRKKTLLFGLFSPKR